MKKDSHRLHNESPLDKADYNTIKEILDNCSSVIPSDKNELIQRFGSPEQPIYIDELGGEVGGIKYNSPIVLPIYNGQLELIQCALLEDQKPISILNDGKAKGFAYFGDIQQDKPVIITHSLESFFKIARTGYAVVLVVLPTLCNKHQTELKQLDLKQIQAVINQLSRAGYTQLYMPVRPEHIELFKELEQHTAVRLLNQYTDTNFIDLTQYDEDEDVLDFLNYSIASLPKTDKQFLPIYSLDEIKYPSDKTAAEILEQLNAENDPFKCAQFAYAYTFKCLPSIPYKESLKSVRANLESKVNGDQLDLIFERAQWVLDKNKAQALQAITIHDTKQHRHLVINDFDELTDPIYKGVILVKAPTGKGKTQRVGKPFAEWCQSNNYTFLAGAHLRSLISELSKTLNTSHYEDEKKTYSLARKAGKDIQGSIDSLSVCIPSFLNAAYSKFMSNVRYVFIDEITQVLNVFASDRVFSSADVEQVFSFFKERIRKAECLIVADANINQQTIDFIESCRPNEIFNIVEIKPQDEQKKAWLYESDKELTSKILNDVIGLNKKVWITCDSPKQGRLLYELFSNRGIKARLILGQDHKIKGTSEFLKAVSNESLNYQVVIASPAISSGVSVEHESPYFDYVAGFFCGTSVRSTDAYQMLGRVRYAKEFHLSLSQKSSAVISHESTIAAKQAAAEIEGGKVEVTSLTKHLERIAEHDSKDRNNFANNLYYMLEYYHFEIMRAVYAYDPTLDLSGIRKELNEADKQGILNAQVITAEQADKFRRSDYLERSEYYALKAYDKRMYLNMSYDAVLTEQHLEINIAQLKRFNAFFGRYEAATDKSKDLSLRHFSEATAKLYKDAFSCIDLKGGAAYDEATAKQILDHIEPHRLKLATIGAIPKGFGCDRYKRKKSAVKELNAIFTHIGISQKRINNPYNRTERQATIGHMPHNLYRNIGGKCPLSGDKVYSIDSEKLDQQQQLAELHLAKSNTIELKTVSEQQQDKEPSNESPYFAMIPSDAGFYAIDPDDDYWQTGTS